MGWFSGVRAYFRADNAEASARNTIAATVLANIPFYPLYAAWIVGGRAWPTLLSFLSWPLFAIVPAMNRRSALAAQWSLLAAGLVDTGLCACGLGRGSGVELFYLPIVLLPIVLYRSQNLRQRVTMLAVVPAVFAWGRLAGGGLETYSSSDLHGLTIMHAVSVSALTVLILFLGWRLRAKAASR